MLLAVPEFNGRVAPTFDYCHKVTLWRLDSSGARKVGERKCSSFGPAERSAKLAAIGVDVLLCGAIGVALGEDIGKRGIRVISGLCGDVVEVVAAYASHTLDHPKFRMPGAGRSEASSRNGKEVAPWTPGER